MSDFSRQYTRSAFVFADKLLARKFLGRSFIQKMFKEIISGLFFPEESYLYAQHSLVYMAGFFNLRYLNRRWF